MTIEVKNLIDQAIDVATERREQALSEQAAKSVKGGRPLPIAIPPTVLGIFYPDLPIKVFLPRS